MAYPEHIERLESLKKLDLEDRIRSIAEEIHTAAPNNKYAMYLFAIADELKLVAVESPKTKEEKKSKKPVETPEE